MPQTTVTFYESDSDAVATTTIQNDTPRVTKDTALGTINEAHLKVGTKTVPEPTRLRALSSPVIPN